MTKVVLLADGEVGLACVNWILNEYKNDIGLIVTIEKNDIYRTACNSSVPAYVYKNCSDLANKIGDLSIDFHLGLLLWWPKIVKEPLLSIPKNGFVNTHPSLLPHNRGKHYSFWAIVEECPFGVSLHKVDQGIDSGDIVSQSSISVDWTDTGETLHVKAKDEMVKLFAETYPTLRQSPIEGKPQPKDLGSFHHSSEIDSVVRIELDRMVSARSLLNLLRAKTFAGRQGCVFEDNGKLFEVSVQIKEIKS